MMDYKKLEELNNLRQSGALTEEEFEREKQKLFEEERASSTPQKEFPMGLQENSYLALMNFLILAPYVGWILPIILWVMGKDISSQVDKQGKYILNWYITWFIGGIILLIAFAGSIPTMLFNGVNFSPFSIANGVFWFIPIGTIISILSLAFPIIGGIKGLNLQTWKYPLSFQFLK